MHFFLCATLGIKKVAEISIDGLTPAPSPWVKENDQNMHFILAKNMWAKNTWQNEIPKLRDWPQPALTLQFFSSIDVIPTPLSNPNNDEFKKIFSMLIIMYYYYTIKNFVLEKSSFQLYYIF